MLDRLFAQFDALCHKYALLKAETIGDAFLAVAGIPDYLSDHVARVAAFALEALHAAGATLIDEERPELGTVQIRVRGGYLMHPCTQRAPMCPCNQHEPSVHPESTAIRLLCLWFRPHVH